MLHGVSRHAVCAHRVQGGGAAERSHRQPPPPSCFLTTRDFLTAVIAPVSSYCIYLRIENAEGNVLIAVYLFICMRVTRIT